MEHSRLYNERVLHRVDQSAVLFMVYRTGKQTYIVTNYNIYMLKGVELKHTAKKNLEVLKKDFYARGDER